MTESKWEVVPSGVQNGGCSTTGMQKKSTSLGVIKTEGMKNDQFPVGMRVLVVDDDPICLMLLERLLKHCNYQATTCSNALSALELLRANRENFDLVISDVHMPDMDGFKLLELVGLEMDLPVIMMSANGETSAVMKGIMHGACDYLLKPVRAEELRNIWQHVVRKKNKNTEQTLSCEEAKHKPFSTDDGDLHTSGMSSRKRKDNKEEEGDGEQDENDPSPSKKPRVVWSIDLHQQFVNAVNQLGIDKAVPKRVLELMNVQGLTRENVASHLQKYRLYLKRINGHQQGSMDSPFMGVLDSSFGLAMDGGSAACLGEHNLSTPQLSQEALISSLHAGLLGKLNATNLQFASNQGLNNSATMRALFGQSLQHSQPLHHVQPSISLPPHSSQDLGQHSLGQPLHHGQPSTSLPPHSGQDLSQHSLGLSHLQDNLATSIGLGGMHGIDNSIVENALIMEMLERGHNIGDDACIQNANQLRPGSVSPLAVSSFLSDHLGNPPQSLNKGVFHGLSGSLPILSNSKASPSLIPSRHCNELDIVDMNRLGSHGLATPSGVVHDLGGKVSSWQAWDSHSSLPSQKLGHIPAPSSLLTTQLNNASTTKGLIDRFSVGEQGLQGGSILSHHHHHHHHHNEPSPSIVGADGSGSINSSSRSILYHSEPLAASVEWKGKEGLLHPSSTSKVDNLALSESFQPWTIF